MVGTRAKGERRTNTREEIVAMTENITKSTIREVHYTRLWKRIVGIWIDFLVIPLIFFVLSLCLFPLIQLGVIAFKTEKTAETFAGFWASINFLALFIINFIFIPGKYGVSLGKMIMGSRIVRDDYSSINYKIALIRSLSLIVFLYPPFTFFTGYLTANFDSKRQSLHDKIAKTYVVKKRGLHNGATDKSISDDNVVYAPVLHRIGASLIDLLMIILIGYISSRLVIPVTSIVLHLGITVKGTVSAFLAIYSLMLFVLTVIYFILIPGKFSATLGKIIMGLKILRIDYTTINVKIALLRFFTSILPIIFSPTIPVLTAIYDPKRQSLHEKIAKTYVIDRQ